MIVVTLLGTVTNEALVSPNCDASIEVRRSGHRRRATRFEP